MRAKYKYRHKMLGYLYAKIKNEPLGNIELAKSKCLFKDMAADLKIDALLLREHHHGFHALQYDHVKCEGGKEFYIRLTEAGAFAYTDEYWLREGKKELNERIYDRTKWIVPILSLIIAIGSAIYTYIETSQIKAQQPQQQSGKFQQLLPSQSNCGE